MQYLIIGAIAALVLAAVASWLRRRTRPCDGTHPYRRFYTDGAVRCHDDACQTWLGDPFGVPLGTPGGSVTVGGDPARPHSVHRWPMEDRRADRMASGGW